MKKELRLSVWRKYNKRCAYCGKELEYKDMQVDHYIPQRLFDDGSAKGDKNNIDNLMPSCRRCNNYKRDYFPGNFRENPKALHERVLNKYICNKDYGIIKIKPFDGEFCFEKKHLKTDSLCSDYKQ